MQNMDASSDVKNVRGDSRPFHTGLTSSVIPEAETRKSRECSHQEVSTRNILSLTALNNKESHWYALRTTNGREKNI